MHNKTWRTSRTIEVPIVRDLVKRSGSRILEVGNVLQNYYEIHHQVLDRWDTTGDAIHEDAATLRTREPYDLIVNISTLEHIGQDEPERDPAKACRAVEKLLHNLAPGGTMVATFPLGYNSALDKGLREQTLPFNHYQYMEQVSRFNRWSEISSEEALREKEGVIVIAAVVKEA